jgi:hypothetical protein
MDTNWLGSAQVLEAELNLSLGLGGEFGNEVVDVEIWIGWY